MGGKLKALMKLQPFRASRSAIFVSDSSFGGSMLELMKIGVLKLLGMHD